MSCPTQDHRSRGSVLLSFAMTDADQVFQHSHGTALVTPAVSLTDLLTYLLIQAETANARTCVVLICLLIAPEASGAGNSRVLTAGMVRDGYE